MLCCVVSLRDPTVSVITRNHPIDGTVEYVATETVLSTARSHFGCTTLPGGQLENAGGTATMGVCVCVYLVVYLC